MTNTRDVLLGIDLGTQSAKAVLLGADGAQLALGQAAYPLHQPSPDRAEQDPADWWAACQQAVRAALHHAKLPPERIAGIGLSGQMHGVLLLDGHLQPLGRAIIWMDRRSADLIPEIMARLPDDVLHTQAANRLSPGFAGASLAWLYQHQPDALASARYVVQPKDYLRLCLTGEVSAEPSDASATWLYDVTQGSWSEALCVACNVAPEMLPPLHDSHAVAGHLMPTAARALGLPEGIPVVAGAADQAALLCGAGLIEAGQGGITLGTGAQMTLVTAAPRVDPRLRLNTFRHALPDRWYTMGAILNGGIALRWWREAAGQTGGGGADFGALLAEAEHIPAGAEGALFLPYLAGERTPHMDPAASGLFAGLRADHGRAHLTRAVLEGVAFALRDCLDTLAQVIEPMPAQFVIGGGGAQGALWLRIIASVLNTDLITLQGDEHTACGAAMLAGVGVGLFADMAEAVQHCLRYGPRITPDAAEAALYAERHAQFAALYRLLRVARAEGAISL